MNNIAQISNDDQQMLSTVRFLSTVCYVLSILEYIRLFQRRYPVLYMQMELCNGTLKDFLVQRNGASKITDDCKSCLCFI